MRGFRLVFTLLNLAGCVGLVVIRFALWFVFLFVNDCWRSYSWLLRLIGW